MVTWLVLSHAWFTDDAYFSFRTIDNFVNGYGLTWNVSERVQVFTHPLWVLLLSIPYTFTHEIYLTSIFTSLLLTLVLVGLIVFGLTKNIWRGICAVLLLCLSTAFIDYSSSGLENPLTHLLLGGFLILFLREGTTTKKLFWLSFIASLGTVNRLDTALFYFPALIYEWSRQGNKWRAAGAIIIGMLPLMAWELFSIIYYGFPFPNTYYAKTQNFVGLRESVWNGLNYFLFTFKFDPITLTVILSAIITAAWQRSGRGLVIAAGIALYLFYILSIGGDFMGGRFLSAAYLSGVVLLTVFVFPRFELRKQWVAIPAIVALSLAASSPPYFLYPKNFTTSRWPAVGNVVVDERQAFRTTNFIKLEMFHDFNTDPSYNLANKAVFLMQSILRGTAFRTQLEHDWVDVGRDLRRQAETGHLIAIDQSTGIAGFFAGPQVHFIQALALTDPFLSRLPPAYYPNWRSGHFIRFLPSGYEEVEEGLRENLDDPLLDAYLKKIRVVTRGNLYTWDRWVAIWELNLFDLEDFLPGYEVKLRFPNLTRLAASSNGEVDIPSGGINFYGNKGTGIQIDFVTLVRPQAVEISFAAGDSFEVFYINKEGDELGSSVLISEQTTGFETYTVTVPAWVSARGISAIRILPIRAYYYQADRHYLITGFSFVDQ